MVPGGSRLDSIKILDCTFVGAEFFSNMVHFAYVEQVSPSLYVDAYASHRLYTKIPKLCCYGYVGSTESL